jgi:hypothetical protein
MTLYELIRIYSESRDLFRKLAGETEDPAKRQAAFQQVAIYEGIVTGLELAKFAIK